MTNIREMIDASNGLTDWNLTIQPRVDDELSRAILDHVSTIEGEFKPSEISQEIFGDAYNSHALAVGQRLKLLAEAGEIRHVRACIYTAQPERKGRVIVSLGDNVVALVVPEIEDDDVWRAIEGFDDEHGTDLWETLNEDDVLGVDLPEYRNAPELDGVCETIYRGAPARRIVEEARNTEPWDSDGQDDDEWFAVQKGVTSDGWPMTIRYAFPIGFEPENDKDCWGHILDVVVVGPAESEGPEEVSADIKVSAYGNSLVLRITDQARTLGVDQGDVVSVTIRRKRGLRWGGSPLPCLSSHSGPRGRRGRLVAVAPGGSPADAPLAPLALFLAAILMPSLSW